MAIELSDSTIKKLDFIDHCREIFSSKDNEILKLPQIIVVGDQSSGKSSILEALSGIKLPKGVNTVTKRPIVVQMRRSDSTKITIRNDTDDKEAESANADNIEEKLRKVQGDFVTRSPIFVNVQSPHVPPLTVIDLPGIVQQALIGQPDSIVRDTQELAKEYMNQENSLILCVIPSNVDFNTIGTINLAAECDAKKMRTIGVLTKMDKLSAEEIGSKIDILNNQTKHLEKGYYGLILSDSILSLRQQDRENEEMKGFCAKGDLWKKCSSNLGLRNFTKKLVEELVSLINQSLPVLDKKMTEYLNETNRNLERYDNFHGSIQNQRKYLIEVKDTLLTKVEFSLVKGHNKLHEYPSCVHFLQQDNLMKKNPEDKHDTFLHGQHLIFRNLYAQFDRHYKENFKIPTCKYTVKYLQDLSNRCSTEHLSVFISAEPFKEVMLLILEEFKKFSLSCLDLCYKFTGYFIRDLISNDPKIEPSSLKNELQERCLNKLNKQNKIAENRINLIFKSERPCFTQKLVTDDKDSKDKVPTYADSRQSNVSEYNNVQGASSTISRLPGSQSMNIAGVMKDKEGDNVSMNNKDDPKISSGRKLKDTLEGFIQKLIQRLGDDVPKFIMLTLFEEFHEHLKETLIEYITSEDVLEHFKLSDSDQQRNDALNLTKENLETSLRKLKLLLKSSDI